MPNQRHCRVSYLFLLGVRFAPTHFQCMFTFKHTNLCTVEMTKYKSSRVQPVSLDLDTDFVRTSITQPPCTVLNRKDTPDCLQYIHNWNR